ncbi:MULTISPECIES: YccS family putative transporter [Variovorax]|jgi:YccS/YhfK family integral membrane protein|uniref:YccS family putative transporter n=1 Tax=Variovorax TaxID=34072 RepID=UPI00086A9FE5|nr:MULTISPECIES: YccS family putative transporter [Variovorax]MBN8755922.1 TIGR01666 family membrane protein [Variovorax sp.]ODU15167.1 MAG: TIGR01666 family membrane protein [Variovorax sp. SCN 67-85]ODV17536.1 MAG: TIGR01666 family membrane protein [Variovorax sp. SCN 67-20]OJZ10377.1 MAG: TIGR01666 family membrane protein [Variovorax sp. 67-131]UKI06551.1 YccS family putative transporter [Variovorax paradoxus]
MLPLSPDALRQRLRSFASRAQPVRILLTLGSLMALCGFTGHPDAVIPLFLGAIASALAETDDSWRGRLRAQVVTLACFAAIAFAVEALFGLPWLFITAFALAAFCLTMLGAVEARYKAIAYATLILAMYATLGIENMASHGTAALRGREPLLLLAGAAWYGVFSVLWCAIFPAQPVQARLVTLFTVLGNYVRFKASLFEPLRGIDIERKRLALAQLNAEVVSELNAAKESIFRRIGARAPTGRISRYRGLYLIAQDVHERASSSHDDYNALADAFFHSDLLYRCQRVLGLQGLACLRLSESIARREPFDTGTETVQALADLRSAIEHERARAVTPERLVLLASVEALARNLAQLDGQLAGASQPSARAGRTEMGLFDRSPRSWRDAVERVRRQLTVRSPLFRHALRLSIALVAGYGVMQVIHPAQGYWILLTTLFVCQQTYGDTIARMGQRIAGTALGVVAGWALLQLFPQPLVQSVIAVAAGVVFFATRATRYLLATASMTLLVLMCFNQVGDSGVLLVPRLVDTAIGSAIAGLAVLLVLPHWQARRINELAATAMRGHAGYLRQIVEQYRTGARDHLDYRLARRNDHNADAALSTAVSDMFREPGYVRPRAGVALRFLIRSHTLLSYLSALGAHRAALPDSAQMAVLRGAAEGAVAALEALAAGLESGSVDGPRDTAAELAARSALAQATAAGGESDPQARTFHTEMALIWLQIDALRTHASEWLQPEGSETPTAPA